MFGDEMYAALAELVRRRSGIKLALDNPELIDDKLAPVARPGRRLQPEGSHLHRGRWLAVLLCGELAIDVLWRQDDGTSRSN